MNKLQLVTHWPVMWWRRKGFGIHSPFAFSLITRTIAERGEYYAYPALRKLAGADFSILSLLFRLICRFKPSTVRIISSDSRLKSAVTLADSRISFTDADSEMIVIDRLSSINESDAIFNTIDSSRQHPAYIVIYSLNNAPNRKLWEQLIGSGMTFSDGKTGIICLSPNLPHQSFSLLF